jgi:hypothetical protein
MVPMVIIIVVIAGPGMIDMAGTSKVIVGMGMIGLDMIEKAETDMAGIVTVLIGTGLTRPVLIGMGIPVLFMT